MHLVHHTIVHYIVLLQKLPAWPRNLNKRTSEILQHRQNYSKRGNCSLIHQIWKSIPKCKSKISYNLKWPKSAKCSDLITAIPNMLVRIMIHYNICLTCNNSHPLICDGQSAILKVIKAFVSWLCFTSLLMSIQHSHMSLLVFCFRSLVRNTFFSD